MGHRRSIQALVSLALAMFLVVSCSGPAAAPTATAVPPTATPAPPTATPAPPTTTPAKAKVTPGAQGTPGAAASDIRTRTLEDGWVLYEKPSENFGIALPPKWKQIDMDKATMDAAFSAVKEQNPQMATLLEGQVKNLFASGVKFMGFDLAPETVSSNFLTNINIMRSALPGELSLDVVVQAGVGQIENLPNVVKPVTHKRVKVTAGDAEEVRYGMTMNDVSGKPVTLAGTQYYIVKGKDAYAITLTGKADQADKFQPVFEKIGQSFRLLK